ncbi:enoyl-CoA hydratase [Cryobacterium psychrotolerans]|uniref:3-hydroxyisobutyryl-CoA hydrolase n=1 Tax=Cryobacterium psychrotolerans TaxID=386301 RepID=A0A1G8Y722_9MICO|nr:MULTISPECIES: enoyl-CoA hydratase/isomerase family protein [Cryobacterium]TFD49347.1 enoyl-CoA hydratase/isomerase family protein [Cryobacterium sp. TMT1-2-1]TFD90884.1 enoyl-CoA hydratase/isomerase family protein [Cryobacterium psychrotolerans]SDJ98513.1 enoyl-CoA hydratase [Cryobacterium psychrotolerans]
MTSPNDEILLTRTGRLGHIVLNRPATLNALTHAMLQAIGEALNEWEHDDEVQTVLISGAGERGLCAGGDIVAIYNDAQEGGGEAASFWADEYVVNAKIASYPKPYVAFMDGIVLGGGVGVSAHGSARIVTERTRIGMPEVGIGFAPDVGGTYLLARAPGELGTHVALTGGMFTGADALELGLADHFVPSEDLVLLARELETVPAADAIARFAGAAPPSALAGQRAWIDECYSADDASEIVARLQASDHPDARAAASVLVAKSPTAVCITLESLRRARRLGSVEEALNQEYRVTVRLAASSEFMEGVRAQVIDKDRNPRWSPATLPEVDRAVVESYFASLGPRELGLSAHTIAPAGGADRSRS